MNFRLWRCNICRNRSIVICSAYVYYSTTSKINEYTFLWWVDKWIGIDMLKKAQIYFKISSLNSFWYMEPVSHHFFCLQLFTRNIVPPTLSKIQKNLSVKQNGEHLPNLVNYCSISSANQNGFCFHFTFITFLHFSKKKIKNKIISIALASVIIPIIIP